MTTNGYQALTANTTGWANTANGAYALYYNTNGNANTANGYSALFYNASGSGNTANGAAALFLNTSGSFNTANGDKALYSNTSGSDNTANGFEALSANLSGSQNTADGYDALAANTSGSQNTVIGVEALANITNGNNNIALGYLAGWDLTTGNNNIYIGSPWCGSTENNTIRIGDPGTQITTYIAGVINGNGGGLTSLNAANLTGTLPNGVLPTSPTFSGTVSAGGFSGSTSTGTAVFGQANSPGGWAGILRYATDGNNCAYLGGNGNAAIFYGTVTVNGTFNNNSDRNAKDNFAKVQAADVLAKVARLPVTEWNYKNDAATRHIGPMAQDFYAAFNVGTDERHIAPIDESGVALAAIQGLNQKLNEKDAEIQDLKQSVAELKAMVEKLAGK